MIKLVIAKKCRLIALALAAFANAGTAPAFATVHHRATQFSRQLNMFAPDGLWPKPLSREAQTSALRKAAIHECNVKAGKVGPSRDWQTTQFAVYGNCMAEHGQRFG